jgi:membrane protease YdiL (CAAX protease family)
MGSPLKRFLTVARAGVLAFLILAFGQGVWGALLATNFKTGARIPWGPLAMALVLWLMWQYLGGKWWPHNTAEARRRYLRARVVPGPVFAWVLLAGILSIVALAGYWIVMFQLVKMPGNVIPSLAGYPFLTVALVVIMASLVAPFTEEPAFRGYCQEILERDFSGPVAIVISSVFFALAHITHGFLWPKLLVYFLVGLVFGVTAYLTNSILPGIPVHIMADMSFFTLIWPHDTARRLVWEGGADTWFWVHAAQALIFTLLAILVFRRLARMTEGERIATVRQPVAVSVSQRAG